MSDRNVCPGLYRDEKGKFYCAYAGGTEVDPAFMPCLSEYWECPYYISYQEREEEIEKPEEHVAVEEEVAKEDVEPVYLKEEEEKETPILIQEEKPIEEELLERLEEISSKAVDLNRLWDTYNKEARALIEYWDSMREEMEKLIMSIQQAIDTYIDELSKLEVKYKLGIIDETLYQELKSDLERKISEKRNLQDELIKKLNEVERLILPHFKRVKVAEAKPEIAKLRLALSKLEQRYKDGQISEEVYLKLKSEIEDKIKKLERVKEEVE